MFSGLVGSTYHIVAFQPDTALAAVQRATNTTVTMGKYLVVIEKVWVYFWIKVGTFLDLEIEIIKCFLALQTKNFSF